MSETEHSDSISTLLEKKTERERVLEQVLELLDRAEERHRDDRDNRRKWNRILTRLEDSLVEVKKAVAECDTLIDVEQRRAGESVEPTEEGRVSARPEEESPAAEPNPERRAALKIAASPIEELPSIPLQDVGFARAYTARRSFGAHDEEFRRKLSTKLELASQLHPAQGTGPGRGERRYQPVLREAVVKVQKGDISGMRDEEIDLLVGCYRMLSDRLVTDASNTRLLDIISTVIDSLLAERASRRLHSR